MSNLQNPLYVFTSLVRGNWRNAFYIECKPCPYGRNCSDYLMTTDTEGVPILYPVSEFEKETLEKIDKNDCASIISKEAFECLYNRWLVWNVADKKQCSLLQITKKYTLSTH